MELAKFLKWALFASIYIYVVPLIFYPWGMHILFLSLLIAVFISIRRMSYSSNLSNYNIEEYHLVWIDNWYGTTRKESRKRLKFTLYLSAIILLSLSLGFSPYYILR